MERQTITVDIAPGNNQIQRLKSSQGDIGRPLGVYIAQNGVALDCSAYTADLYILKPDGNYFTATATVDATEHNLITWETAKQETPVAGDCAAQIRILSNGDDVGTARFVEYVEASPGVVGESSESVVESLMEYVRQAATSAETASGAASSASGSASAASGSASSAAQSASAAAGSASTAHTDAETASQAAQTAHDVADSIPEDYSTLSNDVTSLKSAFEQLNDNVITDSAGPAPIVSIADGADGMPMRKVEVAIEPVQDLHGYDSPWPAGGQLWDEQWELGYYNDDGSAISNNNRIRSKNRILISPSTSYYTYAGGSNNYETYLLFYDENDAYIDKQLLRNVSFTTPANANSCLFYVVGINTYSNNISINFPSTITEYRPYSNICPITGWTGAKVTRTGKNLLPNAMVQDTSTRVRLGESTVGNGIRLKAGTYRISYAYKDGTVPLTPYWRTVKDGVAGSINNAWVIAIDEDTNVRIWLYNSQGVSVDNVEWAMVELGSTATAYEPYQGQTYEVTFPTEAGTVYGGTLTVNEDGSGTLVVDRGFVDTQSNTWTLNAINDHGVANFKYYKSPYEFDYTADIITNLLPYDSMSQANATKPGYLISGGSTLYVRLYSSEASTVAEFKQWASANGLQILLKLATPVTYQLTNQQVIEMLKGVNNVWSDAGNTAITYPADTKLYIDRKITEAVANALNA